MIKLILHLSTIFIFLISFFFLKKSSRKERFLKWLGIGILAMMLCNSVIAGIYGLCNIPIGVVTVDIPLLIISFVLLFYSIHDRQEYFWTKSDCLFIYFLIFITILFWIGYFHLRLPIRYVSVDASTHCRWARQIAMNHKLESNLFFGYVNDGLIMESLFPLTGSCIVRKNGTAVPD